MTRRNKLSKFFTAAMILVASVSASESRAGADACRAAKRELLRRGFDFTRSALVSGSLRDAAAPLLRYVESFRGEPCEAEVRGAYAALSILLLHPSDAFYDFNLRYRKLLATVMDLSDAGRLVPLGADADSGMDGRYRCATATVEVNFELDPYNLGAVLYHELSHFYRDRGATDDRAFGHEAVIADEVLAMLQAAWAQFRLVYDLNRWETDRILSRRDYFARRRRFLFGIFPELLFTREKGPLFEIFRRKARNGGMPLQAPLSDLLPADADDLPVVFPQMRQVIADVNRVYFPGKSYDEPRVFASIADILWPTAGGRDTMIDRAFELPARPNTISFERSQDYPDAWNLLLQSREERWKSSEWSEWRNGLDRPSDRCREEIERFSKEGSRPSKEGSRPSKEGSRPCLRPKSKL